MHFHLATFDDIEAWANLREELYHDLDPTFNRAEIKRIIADPYLTTYLIFETKPDLKISPSKKPIGMVELSLRNIVDGCLSSPVAYLEGLYLIDAWQGKGLGKGLIEFVKKWALEQGCTELAVDTELENERAQKFYLREGFEKTYRIVQFRMGLKS